MAAGSYNTTPQIPHKWLNHLIFKQIILILCELLRNHFVKMFFTLNDKIKSENFLFVPALTMHTGKQLVIIYKILIQHVSASLK